MNETSSSTFANQLQDLWRTRPVRSQADGKVAGVAAGIGYRYGVDPLLIRIAFVLSAIFGGAGIALYIACWLALPKAPLQSEADKLSPTRLVALVVLLVVALTSAPFDSDVAGASLLSAVVMLGGLWLLYQRQPTPPGTPAHAAPPTDYLGQTHDPGATGAQPLPPVEPAWWGQTQPPEQEPPAWDPLRTAPFAWDLPEPPARPDPSRAVAPRSRLTTVFLGLALLTAAGATAIAIAGDVAWLTPSRIAAAALAIVGLGLVIGAFLRTGHGLLIAAAPLAGFVILSSLVGPLNTDGGVGGRDFRPATVAELRTEYRVGVGEVKLDLRDVLLDEDRTVDASTGIGRVEVIVPEGMNIRVSCNTDIGDTDCLPDQQAGASPLLTINAHSNIGEVVVGRG